ncbi:MAG: 16S rRNA (adenine(1518)-N(6)/adenine(1519)-N(6))-dimethyltransferase RsmA [Candidatus Omnitrophota bacterium]
MMTENQSFSKSQIVQLSRQYSFSPNKKLGQNFLIDKNITDKIIEAVSPAPKDVFLEIGAGLGALTLPFAGLGAKLTAFEIDKKLYHVLSEKTANFKNVRLLHQDFLEFDFKGFSKTKRARVVGNIPYYITSVIIEKLAQHKECVEDIHLMVQKEFAARLTATPAAGKDYSSITLFANYHFSIEKLFMVRKGCFWPAPDVDSVFLRMKKHKDALVKVKDEQILFSIIRGAFNQRRKTIFNSLSSCVDICEDKEKLKLVFDKAGISPSLRAENLRLEDFVKLANIISQRNVKLNRWNKVKSLMKR